MPVLFAKTARDRLSFSLTCAVLFASYPVKSRAYIALSPQDYENNAARFCFALKVLDLKEMVVGEMLQDRSLMVALFQRCGKAEFKFLVNRCGVLMQMDEKQEAQRAFSFFVF